MPVELFDERMTTVAADRALREAEIGASARRKFVDKVAAAVLLQTWLDRGRSRAPEP
ncbi:MAG: RuvX/YqgF family protein [Actinomycetota bacterium]